MPKIEKVNCSYCGREFVEKENIALHLFDKRVDEERNICILCLIKAFDFVFEIVKGLERLLEEVKQNAED